MEKWLFLVQWCTKFSRLNGKSCALRSLRSLRNETSFKNNIFFLSYQGTDDDGFAKPKLTSSVLGLQELARKRRQEKEEAEDGIRDCLLSRGLGDVYKRQVTHGPGPMFSSKR